MSDARAGRIVPVAVGAVAGVLALASYVELTTHTGRLARAWGHSPLFRHDTVFGLAMGMTTAVAYAAILLVFGRTPRRRWGAALLALAAGFSRWLLLVMSLRGDYPEQHFPTAMDYASSLVPITLATLAWGVARRRSNRWLWAVPIAPLLMGSWVWLWFHSSRFRDFQGGHGMSLIFVLYLGPVVVASLAGWLLEVDRTGASSIAPAGAT